MSLLVAEQTKVLSEYLAKAKFEDLPKEVLERSKLIVADTIGIAFKGSLEPEMKNLYDRVSKGEKAIMFKEGLPKTNDIAMAGFVNSTAICFVELDTFTSPAAHAPLHVLPPVLALSQSLGKSGKDFLNAFILGYEVHHRIEKSTKLRQGVYSHGNTGHIGAAVAVGKLLGWNAEQFYQAINCAASLPLATSWPVCFTESTISSTFASFSSHIAFIIKDLVESGFTGYHSAIDDTYCNILGTEFNPLVMTNDLGSDYGLMNNNFKFYSTCGVIHPAIEAAADALNYPLQHGQYPPFKQSSVVNTDEIKGVKIYSGDDRILKLNFSPGHKQSAKFSLPFALAAYLVTGDAGPETISESYLYNDQVRSLEKRISLNFDKNFNNKNDEPLLAEVCIKFNNGRLLSGKCKNIFGRSGNPANQADIHSKFIALIGDILNDGSKEKLWNSINTIEEYKNVNEIFEV